jgi:hypothetical protein
MTWVGIIGILLLVLLIFGFYLGVPMRWGKLKEGRDLNAGGGDLRRRRDRQREQH